MGYVCAVAITNRLIDKRKRSRAKEVFLKSRHQQLLWKIIRHMRASTFMILNRILQFPIIIVESYVTISFSWVMIKSFCILVTSSINGIEAKLNILIRVSMDDKFWIILITLKLKRIFSNRTDKMVLDSSVVLEI